MTLEGLRYSIPAGKCKRESDFHSLYCELNAGTVFQSDATLRKGNKLQRLQKNPQKVFRCLREIHDSNRFDKLGVLRL